MKKWMFAAPVLVLALGLTNCGKKAEEDEEKMNKIDIFTVDSGSCPKITNEETKAILYDGTCQGTFQTIPANEKAAYSFEFRLNLRLIGSSFQLNLNSINKNYTSGAHIRLVKVGETAAQVSVFMNNSNTGVVTSFQTSRLDPNDLRLMGTIIPSNTGTRLLLWNMKDISGAYTTGNAFLDSANAGHFSDGVAVGLGEIMNGLFRGFSMSNTVLLHAAFIENSVLAGQ